ncbi:protein disaggregation chaperone [mine drainage metagenome]|uniref:Protein disaggregation chaperone n=1 Tax=mine drainage metagenome TaxID=410659 RepID=T0ZTQ7_9ZZZZ
MDFRNTVIVMTSNLGSQLIQEIAGRGADGEAAYTEMKAAVMAVVQAHFRPEFINRLDEIVVFRPLEKRRFAPIARIQITHLEKRLAERQLSLRISDRALDLLANIGFDPVFGARPLKRAVQQQLENPLARAILQGQFQPGDTIVVDAGGGEIGFKREAGAAA